MLWNLKLKYFLQQQFQALKKLVYWLVHTSRGCVEVKQFMWVVFLFLSSESFVCCEFDPFVTFMRCEHSLPLYCLIFHFLWKVSNFNFNGVFLIDLFCLTSVIFMSWCKVAKIIPKKCQVSSLVPLYYIHIHSCMYTSRPGLLTECRAYRQTSPASQHPLGHSWVLPSIY